MQRGLDADEASVLRDLTTLGGPTSRWPIARMVPISLCQCQAAVGAAMRNSCMTPAIGFDMALVIRTYLSAGA